MFLEREIIVAVRIAEYRGQNCASKGLISAFIIWLKNIGKHWEYIWKWKKWICWIEIRFVIHHIWTVHYNSFVQQLSRTNVLYQLIAIVITQQSELCQLNIEIHINNNVKLRRFLTLLIDKNTRKSYLSFRNSDWRVENRPGDIFVAIPTSQRTVVSEETASVIR